MHTVGLNVHIMTKSISIGWVRSSYCLPLLTFAACAVSYNKQQVHDLNVCWKVVYRTVFNFNRWESAKGFINGFGKLSLEYILKVHKVKFHFHLLHSASSLISDLFWLYFNDCYLKDDSLQYIFQSKHAAITDMYEQLSTACQWLVLYVSFHCSLIGIAHVCMIVLGFIFLLFFCHVLANKRVHNNADGRDQSARRGGRVSRSV